MSFILRSNELLRGIEAELREIAQEALDTCDYGAAQSVLDLVQKVSALHDGNPSRSHQDELATDDFDEQQEEDAEFPRFEREHEKLVKIGWANNDAGEYRHRAQRHVIRLVLERLKSLETLGKEVRAADLKKFYHQDGSEVAPVQIQTVLSFLRDSGVVELSGRVYHSQLARKKLGVLERKLWDDLEESIW